MEEKDNVLKNFLDEFSDKEEVNPFEDNLKDPFAKEESAETIENKEEKPLPFNKDSKVQKFIEKEISKRLADLKPMETVQKVIEEKGEDKVTDVLTRLIGNDTPEKLAMVREFKSILGDLKGEARSEALAEIESRNQAQVQADMAAEQELKDAFDFIEENYSVDLSSNAPTAKKVRQEFVSFVERIAPKDRNGNIVDYPDMTSAWETFSEMKKATAPVSRAKELASRSMSRSAEATSAPQKSVDWNEVDKVLGL